MRRPSRNSSRSAVLVSASSSSRRRWQIAAAAYEQRAHGGERSRLLPLPAAQVARWGHRITIYELISDRCTVSLIGRGCRAFPDPQSFISGCSGSRHIAGRSSSRLVTDRRPAPNKVPGPQPVPPRVGVSAGDRTSFIARARQGEKTRIGVAGPSGGFSGEDRLTYLPSSLRRETAISLRRPSCLDRRYIYFAAFHSYYRWRFGDDVMAYARRRLILCAARGSPLKRKPISSLPLRDRESIVASTATGSLSTRSNGSMLSQVGWPTRSTFALRLRNAQTSTGSGI